MKGRSLKISTFLLKMKHLTTQEIENGLKEVLNSPINKGTLEMIVRRPSENEREILAHGELNCSEGLVGDNWKTKGSSKTPDGSAHPDMQLNIMNARFVNLIAHEKERWPLTGDQLFVDLDLSEANVPPGTQLAIGDDAVVEVTAIPHLGCKKFVERFGKDAMLFANSELGKVLHLRGVNAKVIVPGIIKTGDVVRLMYEN